jgi:hypothetical protein
MSPVSGDAAAKDGKLVLIQMKRKRNMMKTGLMGVPDLINDILS